MNKKCEKKNYKHPIEAIYECKKCGRMAKKENKLCKPIKCGKG